MLSLIKEILELMMKIYLTEETLERSTSKKILIMMMDSIILKMRLRAKTSWKTWSKIIDNKMNSITTKILDSTKNNKKSSL